MTAHDSRSPAALSLVRRHLVDRHGGCAPAPSAQPRGAPPGCRPDSWPTLASLAPKAGFSTRDEAPRAPSRGSPRGAGGEFAGFAREEEAARLLTISKSRVATENTEGVRGSRSVI